MSFIRRRGMSRIAAALLLIICILEIVAVFFGPFAFVRKPGLILSPIYAPGFSEDKINRIRSVLERELAAGSAHAVYPRSLIENFYLERDNAVGVFDGSYRGKTEAFELAEHLGVERVAIATALSYAAKIDISLTIYDIATDQVVGRTSVDVPDIGELSSWSGESLGVATPGLSAGAVLYLAWIAFLLILAIAILFEIRISLILLEIMIGSGILLALFSWIYALNGDMDYVQRFVATSGALNLEDTRTERISGLVRYLPPFIILSALWLARVVRAAKKPRPASCFAVLSEGALLPAAISALLYALSLPNFLVLRGLSFLAWIAVAPLYLAMLRVKFSRKLFLIVFFIGLQSLMVNWWQGTFSYVSLPFTVALTLVQSLPFVVLLALSMYQSRWWWISAPLLWTAFDWFRSLGFLGYPWGLLGMSQYAHPPLIQVAALTGVWGVSFLPHLCSAALAWGLYRSFLSDPRRMLAPENRIRVRHWIPLVFSLSLVFIAVFGGAISISLRENRWAQSESRKLRILLVQQNTDPRKHEYQLSFDELSRLTEEAMTANGSFDLVAWPESGFVPDIRFWLQEDNSARSRGRLVKSFLDWQKENNIPLLTGTQDHFYQNDEKHILNSAMYLSANRLSDEQRRYYYKIRLVPFTENFPYGERFPRVAELLHNFSTTQWTAGTQYTVFNTGEFRFSTPICFEDVFPDHVRRFVLAGAEVLVNISNDYWANTPLEGYQHGAHAVFRAVENRRPLVRATCSGWTISVDPSGRISPDYPDFYTSAYLPVELDLTGETQYFTLYTRWGDWFPVSCALIWLILLLFWKFS